MKNYVIGTLLVIILSVSSLFFKYHIANNILFTRFPVEIIEADAPRLYLYVFFSKKNCYECLGIIEVLNDLPPRFVVSGVIPDAELENKKEIRFHTGATFPLESQSKYKRFAPRYTPTVVGVSARGEIFFVLPGVPGEKGYLKKFLDSMYNKLLSHITNGNS
jgi:thioredoxin-related protein